MVDIFHYPFPLYRFRLVDLSMATMDWNHLRVSLCYAPFFILYWCINSLTMNGCNRFKNMSEGKNLLICVLCNTFGTIVVVLVYYIMLYRTGCGIGAFSNWKAYMMLSYMILSATAGTIMRTWKTIYRTISLSIPREIPRHPIKLISSDFPHS